MRNVVVLILLLNCFVAKGQDTTFIVNLIEIEGNKITKNYIIEKEITFHKGDAVSSNDFSQKALRSQQNLINTSLFNFVVI